MLRENSRILTRLHKILDLILVFVSFVTAYQVKRNLLPAGLKGLDTKPNYYLITFLAVIVASFAFRLVGFYEPYRKQRFHDIALKVFKAVLGTLAGLVFILYLLHVQGVSRLLFFIFATILLVLLLLSKSVAYYTLAYYRSRDYNTRNVLIVGTGDRAQRMIRAIQRAPESGYRVLGCLDPEHRKACSPKKIPPDIRVCGGLEDFSPILTDQVVDEIIFATDLDRIDSVHEYIQYAEQLGINVRIMPDFQLQKIMYRPETARIFMDQFAGMPTIALSTVPQRKGELLVKAFMDYIVAGMGVILLMPLFVVISIAIKASSKGPIFFLQERSGLYGRKFMMIKFRTMVENAEELKTNLVDKSEVDGPVFKMTDDPRVTPIGKFLRRTSLDELPQLINVLRGEMSLVGPRPPIPSEVAQYAPWQRRRLSMKPGMTCIWQVKGRNNIDFNTWMKLDLEYIDNWSLFLDLKILLLTVKEVVYCNGK